MHRRGAETATTATLRLCANFWSISKKLCMLCCMSSGFRAYTAERERAQAIAGSLRSTRMLLHLQCGLAKVVSATPVPKVTRVLRAGRIQAHLQTRCLHTTCCMASTSSTRKNQVQKPAELITLVDQQNNVVGQGTRGEMRAQNAIHRCSFVAIFNSQGELYVQKRVSFKETYPSCYDPAPGGVVGADESYEESATREIQEEMGVDHVTLKNCFDFYHEDEVTRLWGRLFSCTYDGDFKLDPEEVESGQFMTVQEVKDLLAAGPVPPDSKACLEKYFAETSSQ